MSNRGLNRGSGGCWGGRNLVATTLLGSIEGLVGGCNQVDGIIIFRTSDTEAGRDF